MYSDIDKIFDFIYTPVRLLSEPIILNLAFFDKCVIDWAILVQTVRQISMNVLAIHVFMHLVVLIKFMMFIAIAWLVTMDICAKTKLTNVLHRHAAMELASIYLTRTTATVQRVIPVKIAILTLIIALMSIVIIVVNVSIR